MILTTTTVEDVDRFLKVFGTTGADKRALHGSKGSTVFRDPAEENRMWVLFEWDALGRGAPRRGRHPRRLRARLAGSAWAWAWATADDDAPRPLPSATPRSILIIGHRRQPA
jgi:hypothetical protein